MREFLAVTIAAMAIAGTSLAAGGCGGGELDGEEFWNDAGGSGDGGLGGEPGEGGSGGNVGGSGGETGSGGTGGEGAGGTGGETGTGGTGGEGTGGSGGETGTGGTGGEGAGGSGGETGTGGTGGEGTGGTGGEFVKGLDCPGTSDGCQCSNGIDDDGDGLVDEFDPECSGPYDNDESSFWTGIPGDNKGSKAGVECFFDGNSGIGNDDLCHLYTPNGCDCFGCCLVDLNGNGTREVAALFNPGCRTSRQGGDEGMEGGPCRPADSPAGRCDGTMECRLDGDGVTEFCSYCGTCEQDLECRNPCEPDEICLGDPPDEGGSGGEGGTGGEGGSGGESGEGGAGGETGEGGSGGDSGEGGSGGGAGGEGGSGRCPPGLLECVTSADCPGASEFCVTGCCIVFQ